MLYQTEPTEVMLPSLPSDIQTHIDVLSSDAWFQRLTPRRCGATDNAFFSPNTEITTTPSVEVRAVNVPIPEELRTAYERYPDDTEFTGPDGWTFLSEREIQTRMSDMQKKGQTRFVDVAFCYAGMGHVHVLSYVIDSKRVFTHIDGGANGWDREDNHARRMALNVDDLTTVAFESWWASILYNIE